LKNNLEGQISKPVLSNVSDGSSHSTTGNKTRAMSHAKFSHLYFVAGLMILISAINKKTKP
jgi:hypothetical protein